MTKWISVKERLPDKDGRYLVNLPWYDGCWVGVSSYRKDSRGKMRFDDELTTHWMELPEGIKKDGKNNVNLLNRKQTYEGG